MKFLLRASHLKNKRYDGIFLGSNPTEKSIVVPFGSPVHQNYLFHKDEKRRERYLKRHAVNEDWNNPFTAGALSRWILWGPTTDINKNIELFKSKFNLK